MPFTKGHKIVGNRKGRPHKPEIEELRQAFEKVAQEKGERFLVNYVRRAYKDSPMAIALLKKVIADKLDGETLTDMMRTILVRPK